MIKSQNPKLLLTMQAKESLPQSHRATEKELKLLLCVSVAKFGLLIFDIFSDFGFRISDLCT